VVKGTLFRIRFGPFAGLDGVVISATPQRTIVRVTLRSRPVLVELDPDMIRVPVREEVKPSSARPPRSRPA
jgi:transcription antitermination factor NusG